MPSIIPEDENVAQTTPELGLAEVVTGLAHSSQEALSGADMSIAGASDSSFTNQRELRLPLICWRTRFAAGFHEIDQGSGASTRFQTEGVRGWPNKDGDINFSQAS